MLRMLLLSLIVALPLLAESPSKEYPFSGVVEAMRTESRVHSSGVYSDWQGKVHGGGVSSRRVPVFLIRSEKMDYEVTGKKLAVGAEVRFRVEKDRLYVQRDEKETKYRIVGQAVRR